MIYRIRNPYTYSEDGTITELDSINGIVRHRHPSGMTSVSEGSYEWWMRTLKSKGIDVHQEHARLESDGAFELDEGL